MKEGALREGAGPSGSCREACTRAAAATTSHCLLQLSSDTAAAPPVCAAGPAPPPQPELPLVEAAAAPQWLGALAAPIGRVSLVPSPPALPSRPLRNPAPPAPLPSAADGG
ncbi:protein EARLY FLOWERING 5-like isoform X2 [Lutra lutra]|uniref:protein EARLY FLOWERING 5-like isoform X2 n=1 Tax=Lutra lutra TaxID=9657 RepID=UPI001FD475DC|nr:protein EARLY FLOWERING 5-like isoform X2 [Lutra lutra]